MGCQNPSSNVFGYRPNQLVFGKNYNLPSSLADEHPALENVTSSQVVANHLNATLLQEKPSWKPNLLIN